MLFCGKNHYQVLNSQGLQNKKLEFPKTAQVYSFVVKTKLLILF